MSKSQSLADLKKKTKEKDFISVLHNPDSLLN